MLSLCVLQKSVSLASGYAISKQQQLLLLFQLSKVANLLLYAGMLFLDIDLIPCSCCASWRATNPGCSSRFLGTRPLAPEVSPYTQALSDCD
jgi:hypothetical protein